MSILLGGYGRADITPAAGDPMRHSGRVKEIADPVSARAVCLEEADGDGPVILAMADTTGFTRAADRRIRAAIAEATGVPVDRVRVNASHNHSCPDGDRTAQELLEPYDIQHVSLAWLDRVEQRLVQAAAQAFAARRPAVVFAGMAPVEGIAANRSVRQPDGSIATRYGVVRPDLVHLRDAPAGTVDPDTLVLSFRGEEGVPIVTLVNYACHATSLRDREVVSPDYPGYALDIIERETGGPGFFLQGAGGNVGTGKYSDGSVEGVGGAQALGRRLASAALAALGRAVPCAPAPLRFTSWEEVVALDAALPLEAEARAAIERAALSRPGQTWITAAMLQVVSDPAAAQRCQLFLMDGGDWCLAGLPAESFVEFGLAIRAASPRPFTLVGAYYDCTLWYIPTWKAMRDGGFEAHGGWRYVAAGAGEQLTASVIARLRPPMSRSRATDSRP
jgi:hypothetical protein